MRTKLMLAGFALTVLLMGPVQLYAQLEPAWTLELNGSAKWQRVTDLGILVVEDLNGLHGIDPDNGNVLWTRAELKDLNAASYRSIPESPFFAVEGGGKTYIVEPFEGTVVFDSKRSGITKIIDQHFLFKSNSLLMTAVSEAGKGSELFCFDMLTGEKRWSTKEDMAKLTGLFELDRGSFIATSFLSIYRISVDKGEVIWKQPIDASTGNLGALSGLAEQLASSFVKDDDIVVDLFRGRENDVYVGYQNKEERDINGSVTVTYSHGYNRFNLEDGRQIWSVQGKGMLGFAVLDKRGLLMFPADDSNTKINLVDYKNGETLWGKKGKGLKVKGSVLDYAYSDKGVLLITGKSDNAFLNLLDPDAGLLKFDKWQKVRGSVQYTELLDKGLLFVTERNANVLNVSSGDLMWSKSINTAPGLYIDGGEKFYVFSDKDRQIHEIDKATAKAKVLPPEIKFEGKELVGQLELLEEGVVLSSEQNVAMIDYSGKLVHQTYHAAPRESGFKRALLYASALRAAYVGAASKLTAAQWEYVIQESDDPGWTVLGSGMSAAYNELGDAGMSYAADAFAAANARFKATTQSADFLFMMISRDKKLTGLAQIDKRTGELINFIDMNKDKEPAYELDVITNQVYYRDQPSRIVCYKF